MKTSNKHKNVENATTSACICLDGAGLSTGRAWKVVLILSLEAHTLDAASNFFLWLSTTAEKSVNYGWDACVFYGVECLKAR